MIESVTNLFNGIIWSNPMIYLCLFTGLTFSVALRGMQVRKIKDMVTLLFGSKPTSSGLSSFQAFALAVSGRVGTGNVVGVVTAIAYGGPGAVFWMWVLAFLGAATTFAECSLAQVYKQKIDGQYRGGPAYFIKHGLGLGWLASLFAICAYFGNAVLHPGVQSDAISAALFNAFGIDKAVTGVFICILLALIIFGGVKRIGSFAAAVVPFMAGAYILFALVLLVINYQEVPTVIGLIFSSAFGQNTVFGGIMGSAIAWGVKRGVYSSEAGMGTSPQHAATADVSHPAKQGLVQAFSVYVDTLFVCTATAIMVLITGMFNVYNEVTGELLYSGLPGMEVGVGYTQSALDTLFPNFGAAFVAIALLFFAFTTLLAAYNIGETNFLYLFTKARGNRFALGTIRMVFLAVTFIGCVVPTSMAWAWADIGLGSMTWLTLVSCLSLFKVVTKVYNDYYEQKAKGLDPIFRPSKLDITNAEIWEGIADEYEAKTPR